MVVESRVTLDPHEPPFNRFQRSDEPVFERALNYHQPCQRRRSTMQEYTAKTRLRLQPAGRPDVGSDPSNRVTGGWSGSNFLARDICEVGHQLCPAGVSSVENNNE